MAAPDENDLTRQRAVADQQLARLNDALRDLRDKYETLRITGLSHTDAVCKLGAELADTGKRDTLAMGLALAAAKLANYHGDIPDPAE